jgi:DNA-binding NarL/FixJ family response regulator
MGCSRPAAQLSEEELALLRLVATGLPMDSVAARLGMSPRTARRRMRDLCERIGVTGTIQAVVWAAHHGLV